MAGRRQAKRDDLRQRLIAVARDRIALHGLAGLRARDVTQDAGCALGGLYTVFGDLDDLVLQVNASTLDRLERDLVAALSGERDPAGQLRILARGYLAFALEHRNLWAALFEHRLADGAEVPSGHLDRHMFLIQRIARPLALLNPGLDEEALRVRALTLFSAAHGIISISLEGRFVGIPRARLEAELDAFVTLLAAGSAAAYGC
jgi:AcrR family transcriptional regulator